MKLSGHLGITRIVKGDRISRYPVQPTAILRRDGVKRATQAMDGGCRPVALLIMFYTG